MLRLIYLFKSLWTKIINLGVTNTLSFSEKRRVHLLNGLAVVGSGGTIAYMVLMLFLVPDNQSITEIDPFYYLNFILIGTFGFVVYLNLIHQHLIGRVLAFVVAIIFYTYVGFTSGKPYEGEIFLILIAVGIFVMFNRLYQIVPLFVFTVACFVLLLINIGMKSTPNFTYIISAGVYIRVITFFIFLFFLLQLYRVEYFKYQRAVEEKNKDLQEKNNEILAQSEILETQAEELSRLNQTKDKLFSIVSHDLRSPISALKSILDINEGQAMSQEDFDSFSKYLKDNVDNLYQMLDNLLKWSQSQQKGINIQPVYFSLNELIKGNLFIINNLCHNKQITFTNKIADEVSAFADKDHAFLILNNLISNAIKFTPHGGSIEVDAIIQAEMVIVSIKDNGIGISEKHLQQLFNPNKMASKKGTAGELGTGLGLFLVREFVEKNGGKIWVQSKEGEGSSFYFSLARGKQNNF